MSECPVETLEKTLVPRLIWTRFSHPLTCREARGFQCGLEIFNFIFHSKDDEA